jgi:hypothetical protein
MTLMLAPPVFFLLVVVSIFLYFAYGREPPRQEPSADTIVSQRTYERWAENIAGRGKTARSTRTRGSGPPSLMLNPTHTRGSSGSVTLSDSPVELSAPPSAYFANAPHSSFNSDKK